MGLSNTLARLAERYLDYHNRFSYDPARNGEEEVLQRLAPLRCTVVFDVGSHLGRWAKLAERHFGGSVIHAFEISHSTYENLSRRFPSGNVVLNDFGLSDIPGNVTYKDYGINSEVNTIIVRAVFHDGEVTPELVNARVSTGDTYCRERGISHIDFLKIDVEGAEHLVLKGFAGLLRSRSIRVIQFEYGYTHGDAGFLMKDFFCVLQELRLPGWKGEEGADRIC
jgi:FkbM family methyltransferase